jgi:hypothetical protein
MSCVTVAALFAEDADDIGPWELKRRKRESGCGFARRRLSKGFALDGRLACRAAQSLSKIGFIAPCLK